MKTLLKRKLYNGMVEIRDYQRDRFINSNQKVRFVIDNTDLREHGEEMILTPAQLKKGVYLNTLESRINKGQTYEMYGYQWEGKKPQEPMDQEADINFGVKTRLSQMWKDTLKTL